MACRRPADQVVLAAWLVALAFGAFGVGGLGCSEGPTPDPVAQRAPSAAVKGVLVVVLDACRPDKLGAYGFQRGTTPVIDALARDPDAVLFRRHYVQGTETKTSTASLLSGLLLREHGVLSTASLEEVPESAPRFRTGVLDDSVETMAEAFRELGYATFGVVKSWHLLPEYGYAQGFDEYYSPRNLKVGDLGRSRKVAEILARAPERFFGYVHLNACHHPFSRPQRDAAYMAEYGFDYDEEARQAAGVDFTLSAVKTAILRREVALSDDDIRFLNLVYEAKLRHVDADVLAPIFQVLRDSGRWDDTLLIVTADHGEELYEHRGYAHGHALWEEVIHVPLIVKFPKGERPPELPREVDVPTRSIDLLPSLLALAGGHGEGGGSGVSILTGERPGFVLSERFDRGYALLRGGHKLIEDDGRVRLFDLEADPGETRDLAAAMPERVAEMRDFAAERFAAAAAPARHRTQTEGPVDPDEVKALRALGYLE
jgi:arylsulfatase A-like enzyme